MKKIEIIQLIGAVLFFSSVIGGWYLTKDIKYDQSKHNGYHLILPKKQGTINLTDMIHPKFIDENCQADTER